MTHGLGSRAVHVSPAITVTPAPDCADPLSPQRKHTALSSNPALLSLLEPHFLAQTEHTFLRYLFLGGVTPCGMHDLHSPTRDRTPTLAPCSGSTES